MKFWHSITEFCFTIWTVKHRLMLIFLIVLAGYAHYRVYESIWQALANSAGVFGLSIISALAWTEQGDE